MLDTTKFPFLVDHSKCLNCQFVDSLDRTKADDGGAWQKGDHLCSSCQWHCAMLALTTRREARMKHALREIEDNLPFVDFEEKSPKDVLEELQNAITTPYNIHAQQREIYNDEQVVFIADAIATLKVIVEDYGYTGERIP